MRSNARVDLIGMSRAELRAVVGECGYRPFYADLIYETVFRHGEVEFERIERLPAPLVTALSMRVRSGVMPPVRVESAADGTRKYLFPVGDERWPRVDRAAAGARLVEAVFIPEGDRDTLCVSTQVGCKMGCRFCLTARQGFRGHLTAAEIINQYYALPERERVTNVVFMGMGEPLDNLAATRRALELFTDPRGIGLGMSKVTVSTVGIVPAMQTLYRETRFRIALSLHSPFEEERAALMPITKAHGIEAVLNTIREARLPKNRRTMVEYLMIAGVNDSDRHLSRLIELLSTFRCTVNLIPYHPIPDLDFRSSDFPRIAHFRDRLIKAGIVATIRESRGLEVAAACGMLSTATCHVSGA